MRMEKLVGERFKETPSDCLISSHALMLRGGYIKNVANGIFSLNTPMKRILRKIENIIREEMDAIEGQEVLFPVVMPASLWEESGRFESVGSELLRLEDRSGSPMVLGMTHEEAAVHLVREYANSYQKYPFMIYQIQTKFRDEARPRGGLIRVREFTMKDAYSFHTSQEDLERYYQECFDAYNRIFARVGLPGVISVAADSGMMGGSISHEFMLLTPVGEDSIAVCTSCDFRANREAAESIIQNKPSQATPLQPVHTPGMETMEEVCTFLQGDIERSCKAVLYQKNKDDAYVAVFIRGDLEVNETKLTNCLGQEVHTAVITEASGLKAGYIGPKDLPEDTHVLFDRSLEGIESMICGANQQEYHYTGLNLSRDYGNVEYIDLAKVKEGGICPTCGQSAITISRGIEVGNIFQLGTKYTKAMGMQYLNKEGKLEYPVMGCYGIGVGRLAASLCEEHHDEHGPIWPLAVGPWQVHICCLRADNPEMKATANSLYETLLKNRLEVLLDDRVISAGVMFSDADLLGVPYRVVVSPRNQKEGCVEIVSRDKTISEKVPLEKAVDYIANLVCKGE